jgi:very-short-patch-repair endonuclease
MNHISEDFLKVVTGKDGNTISKRFTRQYFERNNYAHIWDLVMINTGFLPDSSNMSHRIYALQNGINALHTCPTCKIGISRLVGKSLADISYSEFCSTKCMLKSESRGKRISDGWNKIDKDAANEKRAATMTEKYGVAFNSQREEIHHIWERSKLDDQEVIDKLNNREWLIEQYEIMEKPSTVIAAELFCDYDTVLSHLRQFGIPIRQYQNRSYLERMASEYVSTLVDGVINNDRKILAPYELDVVIPEYKLAIEINGMYWHSLDHHASKEERNRHLYKTLSALNSGYTVLHILESEWNQQHEIVKSIISSRLGKSETVFARKCEIVSLSRHDEHSFLKNNHIQGFVSSSVCYGLVCGGELVQLMSFGKPRFNKNYQWELLRSCAKLNTTVSGGAGRLLSHFRKNHMGNIICYSDRRFGEGLVYSKIGFTFKESLPPSYHYTDRKNAYSRYKFQKKQLSKLLKNFKEELTEEQNMFANGYRKIWDCGNNVYVFD